MVMFLCSEPWPLADLEEKLKNESPDELQDSVEFLEFDPSNDIFEGTLRRFYVTRSLPRVLMLLHMKKCHNKSS